MDPQYLTPLTEVKNRANRIQSRMRESGLDALFVMQNADLAYFAGTIQTGIQCIPPSGEPLYLVQKSLTRARMESPWSRLAPMDSLKKLPDMLAYEGFSPLAKIGLEMDVLPANHYLRFQSLFPRASFVDASDAIRKVRMIKSDFEVDQMRNAATLLHQAFTRIPEWLRPGLTELELAARLEEFLKARGHQGFTRMRAFNGELTYGEVSSGPSASYPTNFPGPLGWMGLYPTIPMGGSRRVLTPADPIAFDYAGGYNGYIVDVTRIFGLDNLEDDFLEAHAFVISLLRKIEAMLKPGTSCEMIYLQTMDLVLSSPYAEGFMGLGDSRVRFIGHGLGLELDELPVLAKGFDMPLECGMTLAIEPKIFFPNRGGVGLENTYLITETGFENLTPYPEEILLARSSA